MAALVLGSTGADAYSERHLAAARRIGRAIESSIANSRFFGSLQREAGLLESLAEIGRVVGSSPDITDVYERLFYRVRTLIPFDRAVLTLLDLQAGEGTDTFVVGTQIMGLAPNRRFPIEGTPCETVLHGGVAIRERRIHRFAPRQVSD
jgi:hypothetical protein